MTKHQIEDLVFKEIVWMRPYKTETVREVLSHLAALSPRGAVIWEVRSQNGKVSYLTGAAARYIRNIEEAIKAHGNIQFHEAGAEKRAAITAARQLKISHPTLSLRTDITEAVIRAELAALTEHKDGTQIVVQIILGRAYSPSPVPADLKDPTATWLQIILGNVQKASAESRKTVKEKSEQHIFQVAVGSLRSYGTGEGLYARPKIICTTICVPSLCSVNAASPARITASVMSVLRESVGWLILS